MKITVNFSRLNELVKKYGIKGDYIDVNIKQNTIPKFDAELASTRGIEVELRDIEPDENGVLFYQRKQIALFIPDHTGRYGKPLAEIQNNPHLGKKYHIADCTTLEDMRQKNRYERYCVTQNPTGRFMITALDREGEVELNVCKNCMSKLGKNFREFNLEEFLQTYTPIFKQLPNSVGQHQVNYAANWAEISREYRTSQNYCCEQCGVDLSESPHLLDTNHRNGVKSDNRQENLEALCKECHAKQDFHGHYYINPSDSKQLKKIKQQQGITK